jgi:hypothetical protein
MSTPTYLHKKKKKNKKKKKKEKKAHATLLAIATKFPQMLFQSIVNCLTSTPQKIQYYYFIYNNKKNPVLLEPFHIIVPLTMISQTPTTQLSCTRNHLTLTKSRVCSTARGIAPSHKLFMSPQLPHFFPQHKPPSEVPKSELAWPQREKTKPSLDLQVSTTPTDQPTQPI